MPHPSARLRAGVAVALAVLPLALAWVPADAQSPTLLRLRNAASADRMVVDSAGGLVVRGTQYRGVIPATGSGARLMWYPHKAAFRAGQVSGTQWDDANTGFFSTAGGTNSTASGDYSTAFGSSTTASGAYAFATGSSTEASGQSSAAMGYNTVASGYASTALGISTTASGNFTTAIGRAASTNNQAGSFVYGDNSTLTDLTALAPNSFSVRAAGGVRFFSNSTLTAGVTLAAGGGSWNSVSDRSRKEHFLAVDGEDVLARIATLPVSTWRYIAEEDRDVRHIGPMAQDWKRAFGFSADSTTINSGDFDGVNLAAVQALAARTDALRAENAGLRREMGAQDARMRSLEDENAALRARLARIEQVLGAGQPRP